MTGAASLVSAAAMRAGSGIVWLTTPGAAHPGAQLVEVVGKPAAATGWGADVLADLSRFGAVVIGPGLGLAPATVDEARKVIAGAPCPIVVDGDGLTAIATAPGGAAAALRERHAATVLTPHDGEFARLSDGPPGGRSVRCRPPVGRHHRRHRRAQRPDDVGRRAQRLRAGGDTPATSAWRRPAPATCSPGRSAPCWRAGWPAAKPPRRAPGCTPRRLRCYRRRAWWPVTWWRRSLGRSSWRCREHIERADSRAGRGPRSISTPSPTTSVSCESPPNRPRCGPWSRPMAMGTVRSRSVVPR